jgi:hypothetical protein
VVVSVMRFCVYYNSMCCISKLKTAVITHLIHFLIPNVYLDGAMFHVLLCLLEFTLHKLCVLSSQNK